MTEIATELMPATGTKINLTACPGPTVSARGRDLTTTIQSYSNCAHFATLSASSPVNRWGLTWEWFAEGLATIENSSSIARSVMVDDVAVLVPSAMPDNVDNLTFNSFGLAAHCQPVVDCLINPYAVRRSHPNTLLSLFQSPIQHQQYR